MESFISSLVASCYRHKIFFRNRTIDDAHKNWLGRHKRGFLRTNDTSYIRKNCCFCSFFTEKTIWTLMLFDVRLSRLRKEKIFRNGWSVINFHYLITWPRVQNPGHTRSSKHTNLRPNTRSIKKSNLFIWQLFSVYSSLFIGTT